MVDVPGIAVEWRAPASVQARMSTRQGGVSAPPYDTMNLGMHAGDAPQQVARNRRRLRAAFGLPSEPRWLRQVHGTRVLRMTRADDAREAEADGAWTTDAQVVLAVMAADCLPVLLARDDGAAVAALHAGWRGLASGVIDAGLDALPGTAQRYVAWLGPRIGPAHFCVHDDVRAAFAEAGDDAAFRRAGDGRWHADLGMLAALRLRRAGVAVTDCGLCTHADGRRFFSHRRDGRCGRMAGFIWRE